MMLLSKIRSGESGILLYGITPPKSDTSVERITEIAKKTVLRLAPLSIDALVLYDVQDESARTSEERPFPFLNALDPYHFANEYLHELKVPKIIYRPAGKFTDEELSQWLASLHKSDCYPVFVGLPSPDHPVKTTLPQAYGIWRKYEQTSVVGAVTIPERHALLKDEDRRILDKVSHGVSYFISQCIFNVAYAKQVIDDLSYSCEKEQAKFPTLIFTFAACGSLKTLNFMEWLGIHIPDTLKEEFRGSDNMLEKSVEVCLNIASELAYFCVEKSIPFGFNIESVAIRKEEVDASIMMIDRIAAMLSERGIRKVALTPAASI